MFGHGHPVLDAVGAGHFACFGSTGSPVIKTRGIGCLIPRPNGSSAALNALRSDIDNGTHCLDFAGVTRGPLGSSRNDLSWIVFAVDGVTAAVRGDSPLDGRSFAVTELRQIYTCQTTQLNGVTLNPKLPPLGSDTRSWWLSTLGLSESGVGACVSSSPQENDGTGLAGPGDIMPFAISSYLAQVNWVEPDTHGDAVLLPMDGVEPISSAGTFNTGFPHTRQAYVVVETARL
ncbi:hypothetical protein ACJ6WF_02335 [Streptomyces sp. MMS24-I2-30]|uniref:hypothetical protein n=1 Tax=Streptomyces sp. MMS24-I2-30 TaxID=3351564 RepID=UPI003896AE9F